MWNDVNDEKYSKKILYGSKIFICVIFLYLKCESSSEVSNDGTKEMNGSVSDGRGCW